MDEPWYRLWKRDAALVYQVWLAITLKAAWGIVPLLGLGLLTLIGNGEDVGALRAFCFGVPILTMLAYTLAAIGVFLALFLLRPLRGFLIGWMITGYIVGAILYGAVGLAFTVAYWWLDLNLMGFDSPQSAVKTWAFATVLGGIMGSVVAGIWGWMFNNTVAEMERRKRKRSINQDKQDSSAHRN